MRPKRTYKTELSNDELLIFDFLAMGGQAPFELMRQEVYSLNLNTSYTHEISDNCLEEMMRKLISKGYLASLSDSELKYYLLTKQGGDLWEIERTPLWEKFCEDSSGSNEDDSDYLEIFCFERDTGLEFAKISLESKLYSFELDDMKLRSCESHDGLYWKNFHNGLIWEVDLEVDLEIESDLTDWDLYEKKRCWWRTLDELQKFL